MSFRIMNHLLILFMVYEVIEDGPRPNTRFIHVNGGCNAAFPSIKQCLPWLCLITSTRDPL